MPSCLLTIRLQPAARCWPRHSPKRHESRACCRLLPVQNTCSKKNKAPPTRIDDRYNLNTSRNPCTLCLLCAHNFLTMCATQHRIPGGQRTRPSAVAPQCRGGWMPLSTMDQSRPPAPNTSKSCRARLLRLAAALGSLNCLGIVDLRFARPRGRLVRAATFYGYSSPFAVCCLLFAACCLLLAAGGPIQLPRACLPL